MEVGRLICDAMLGKLARWLRAAGHDALWPGVLDDEDLLQRARAEQRVLITSDGRLLTHRLIRQGAVRAVFVPPEMDTLQQLRHVLARLGLEAQEPRCMACGGKLEPTEKNLLVGSVPPRVYASFDEFYRCGRCGKVYWPGTHWQRIEERLRQAGIPPASP